MEHFTFHAYKQTNQPLKCSPSIEEQIDTTSFSRMHVSRTTSIPIRRFPEFNNPKWMDSTKSSWSGLRETPFGSGTTAQSLGLWNLGNRRGWDYDVRDCAFGIET